MTLLQFLSLGLLGLAISVGASDARLPSGPVAGLEGQLLVVNKADNSVSVIDLASGKLTHTIPTGRGPHELVLSPDFKHAVVTDYVGGNSLTIIDTETLTRAATIDLSDFPRPHGIEFLSGNDQVIVTSEASANVVVATLSTAKIDSNISVNQAGAHMLAMPSDQQFVYTSNMGSNTVSEISLVSKSKVRDIPVPSRPEAIAVTPDGTEVWVGSNDTGTLNVIKIEDGKVTATAEGFGWPYRILFTPDGKVVVPDLEQNVIRVFNADSHEETGSLTITGAGLQGITLYSDPNILFISLNRLNKVAVIDLNKMEVLGTYNTGNRPDGIDHLPR